MSRLEIARILSELEQQREALDNAIAALEGVDKRKQTSGKRRTMSPEARARIAAGMTRRWAERKKATK